MNLWQNTVMMCTTIIWFWTRSTDGLLLRKQ